jgi:hypothetical protein
MYAFGYHIYLPEILKICIWHTHYVCLEHTIDQGIYVYILYTYTRCAVTPCCALSLVSCWRPELEFINNF